MARPYKEIRFDGTDEEVRAQWLEARRLSFFLQRSASGQASHLGERAVQTSRPKFTILWQ